MPLTIYKRLYGKQHTRFSDGNNNRTDTHIPNIGPGEREGGGGCYAKNADTDIHMAKRADFDWFRKTKHISNCRSLKHSQCKYRVFYYSCRAIKLIRDSSTLSHMHTQIVTNVNFHMSKKQNKTGNSYKKMLKVVWKFAQFSFGECIRPLSCSIA